MTAVAWWIFAGGIAAAGSGLLHDRGGVYMGLVMMAAFSDTAELFSTITILD